MLTYKELKARALERVEVKDGYESLEEEFAPVTQSLRGLLRKSGLDENDYKKYLEKKHL